MKTPAGLLVCWIAFPLSQLLSQTQEATSAFISANAGGFISSREDFERTYNSRLGVAFGGGLGLPVSPDAFLYLKATYFSKTGTPLITTIVLQNGTFIPTESPGSGTITFKQWIFNVGALQNFTISKGLNLGVNGGMTFSTFSEVAKDAAGSTTESSTGKGLLGLFAGVDLEERIGDGPLRVFAESQYNFAWPIISSLIGNYGGINLTAGIRYFFKDSRRR
jgi:hypothetical protein